MKQGFAVLTADPPWPFKDKLPGKQRGAEKNYATMSIEAMQGLVLPPLAEDCHLFLWRVSSMVEEAYAVMRAWGFTPKSEIVWRKMTTNGKPWFGMGRHVRAAHETCIIGVRGKPKVQSRSVRSVFEAKVTKHSAKPAEFFELVETMCAGPYVELFAREHRPGWTCLGDEAPTPVIIGSRSAA